MCVHKNAQGRVVIGPIGELGIEAPVNSPNPFLGGSHGDEIVALPEGAHVMSHEEAMRLLAQELRLNHEATWRVLQRSARKWRIIEILIMVAGLLIFGGALLLIAALNL